jgi:hypothetical protein
MPLARTTASPSPSSQPQTIASIAAVSRGPAVSSMAVAPADAPSAPVAPLASALATATATTPTTMPASSGASTAQRTEVLTWGMHVGGGPFDEATKVPFKQAVEPKFPALAACRAELTSEVRLPVDAGVDLYIEAAGGKPKVTRPRAPKGEDRFAACIVRFFEGIEFASRKAGPVGVSYSVRFRDGKK